MEQNTALSCIDEAILEGIEIGIKEGMEIGMKTTKTQKNVEMVLILLQTLPSFKDSQIALICKVKRPFVTKVRKTFQTDKEIVIKRFVRTTYKNIPDMKEVDFLKLEKVSLTLWKEFKKAQIS